MNLYHDYSTWWSNSSIRDIPLTNILTITPELIQAAEENNTEEIRKRVTGSITNIDFIKLVIQKGNLEIVKHICNRLFDLSLVKACLFFAVEKNRPEVVKFILEKNPDTLGEYGTTKDHPLWLAITKGYSEIIDIMFSKYVNWYLENRNYSRITSLLFLICKNIPDKELKMNLTQAILCYGIVPKPEIISLIFLSEKYLIDLLLDYVDLRACINVLLQRTSIKKAERIETIKAILNNPDLHFSFEAFDKRTFAISAIRNNYFDLLKFFVERFSFETPDFEMLLEEAVDVPNTEKEIIEFLLQHTKTIPDYILVSALLSSYYRKKKDIVDLLIKNGAKLSQETLYETIPTLGVEYLEIFLPYIRGWKKNSKP